MVKETVNEYQCPFCVGSNGEGKIIEELSLKPRKTFLKVPYGMPEFESSYKYSIGINDCSVLKLYERDVELANVIFQRV